MYKFLNLMLMEIRLKISRKEKGEWSRLCTGNNNNFHFIVMTNVLCQGESKANVAIHSSAGQGVHTDNIVTCPGPLCPDQNQGPVSRGHTVQREAQTQAPGHTQGQVVNQQKTSTMIIMIEIMRALS